MPIHYLAYGSNLHPHRLCERVPSAQLIGVVELPGRVLRFCKRSVDGSGKCTVAAGEKSDTVHGAVFRMDEADRAALDRAEGLGAGYAEQRETLELAGRDIEVFYYVAAPEHVDEGLRPYRWYKDLVLAGARFHRFPPGYVAALEVVPDTADPDPVRRAANERLLMHCVGE